SRKAGARPCPGCACAWLARRRRMPKMPPLPATTAVAARTASSVEVVRRLPPLPTRKQDARREAGRRVVRDRGGSVDVEGQDHAEDGRQDHRAAIVVTPVLAAPVVAIAV